MNWRSNHSSVVIKDNVYCWGGDQNTLPIIHDSEDKRKMTSSVDIFHLPTFQWKKKFTTSNPPKGVMEYACTSIGNKLLYFGGSCEPNDCYHNNLYERNSLTNKWEEIVSITPDNEPMRKAGCRMISFSTNGADNFLLLGGVGPIPTTKQTQSQYVSLSDYPNYCYTNETHIMCVSSSPGITRLTLCIVILCILFRAIENTCHNR